MERRLCIGDLCTRMSARSIGDERRATSHGGARCAAGLQRSKRVGESQERERDQIRHYTGITLCGGDGGLRFDPVPRNV